MRLFIPFGWYIHHAYYPKPSDDLETIPQDIVLFHGPDKSYDVTLIAEQDYEVYLVQEFDHQATDHLADINDFPIIDWDHPIESKVFYDFDAVIKWLESKTDGLSGFHIDEGESAHGGVFTLWHPLRNEYKLLRKLFINSPPDKIYEFDDSTNECSMLNMDGQVQDSFKISSPSQALEWLEGHRST